MQNEKIHKRGRYSAEFKEKVALEALSGAKTHAQIASDYGISPDLVKDWKKLKKTQPWVGGVCRLCCIGVMVSR